MNIILMVEGKTEKAILEPLRNFLAPKLPNKMPKFMLRPYHHLIPKKNNLKFEVNRYLNGPKDPADAVIALTDVYTGKREFKDAKDAKSKMKEWVGNESRFYPCAAQYEFEAWLLPFWEDLQKMAKHNASSPGPNPELINHSNPPSKRIKNLFRGGTESIYKNSGRAKNIARQRPVHSRIGLP